MENTTPRYPNHQNMVQGDMSFMESLLPREVRVQHMDSYNKNGERRFQGAFYYKSGYPCNQAPLSVLALATSYQIEICTCAHGQHLTWTISFPAVTEEQPKAYFTKETVKHPIATAPMDGTVIMGYWEGDPDPNSQKVRYDDDDHGGWFVSVNDRWCRCEPPTHWSPITNS